MSKIFETADDLKELAHRKFEETALPQVGINLKVMSVTKSKTPLKIARANATTEFLTKSSDIVTLFIFEEAFDRLSDDYKEKLMEGVLSNVSYDSEKDKLLVDTNPVNEIIRMRKKYDNYVDIVEAAMIIIDDIIEEEKQRKAEEREAKKNKKK